jgi:hypothetical protein
MSQLQDDLTHYANEFYTNKDLTSGIKLLSELMGIASLGTFLFILSTSWLPAVDISLSAAALGRTLKYAATAYSRLNEAERKQVRAVVRWINGGFNLSSHLID